MQRLGTGSGSASLFPSGGPERVRLRINLTVSEALSYPFGRRPECTKHRALRSL